MAGATPSPVTPILLAMWRDIGLERVFVGLEFCTDEDLQFIHKVSTVGDNEQAIKILHDLGIELYASFIVRPEFTQEDSEFFRRYCRRLGLSFPTFAVLIPLPGTDFYEEVKGRMITHDYDFFDFIHTLLPTDLPLDEFYEEYYQLSTKAASPWKQLSTVPKYHLQDLLLCGPKAIVFTHGSGQPIWTINRVCLNSGSRGRSCTYPRQSLHPAQGQVVTDLPLQPGIDTPLSIDWADSMEKTPIDGLTIFFPARAALGGRDGSAGLREKHFYSRISRGCGNPGRCARRCLLVVAARCFIPPPGTGDH